METITNLCKYLFFQDSSFKELEVKTTFPTIFDFLVQNKIIQTANPIMLVECFDCDNGHSTDVISISGRYMTKCEYVSSIREVSKEEITGCSFSSLNFSNWLAQAFSLTEQTKSVDDRIIFLGKKSKRALFLLLETNHDEAQKLASSINEKETTLIWLGDNPKIGHSTYRLVPLSSMLGVSGNKLSVVKNSSIFKDEESTHTLDKNGIVFDLHIAMNGKNELLLESFQNGYRYREGIYPQAYRTLRYLYDMRKKGLGYTSREIADIESLRILNARTATGNIKLINDICLKYKVKPLILKITNHKWVLNPALDRLN